MAIYNNDKDPNVTQWEQEQMEIQILEPRRRFEEWYKQNEERILAEDKLHHDMRSCSVINCLICALLTPACIMVASLMFAYIGFRKSVDASVGCITKFFIR